MTPDLPPMEAVIPAVEHLMGTLDHDAGLIQGVADRLSQSVGASLDADKADIKGIKTRLAKSIRPDVVKRTGSVLTEIGGRLRQAVAQSVEADQLVLDPLIRTVAPIAQQRPAVGPPGLPVLWTPAQIAAMTIDGYGPLPSSGWNCYDGDGNRAVSPCPGGFCIHGDDGSHSTAPPPPPFTLQWDQWGNAWACPPQSTSTLPIGPPIPRPPRPPTPPPVPPPAPPPCPPLPVPAECDPCVVRTDTSTAGCGPLPRGIPEVAVYVVPWLSPGDPSASAWSECGVKAIKDSLSRVLTAQQVIDAFSAPGRYDDIIPGPEDDGSSLASYQGR